MSKSSQLLPETNEQLPEGASIHELGRLSDGLLTATHNPALARLAGAVRQSAGNSAESYSRMHNRHNRS
jgi:hypothetical protein